MTKTLRVVLAQLNLTVGDIEGNLKKHLDAATKARDELAADMIIFPELSLTGYPPEDLLLRKSFLSAAQSAFETLLTSIQGIYCLVNHPQQVENKIFNTASMIYNGKILGQYQKHFLPNYGVFDEARYFNIGHDACVVSVKDTQVGIIICEDLWRKDPARKAKEAGAQCIVCPNASPYETDKHVARFQQMEARAKENGIPILYVNLVGGQDEIIFDGGSFAVDEKGQVVQCAGFFVEKLHAFDIDISKPELAIAEEPVSKHEQGLEEQVYQALVLAVRDYINKNNFPGVLIGVSGGIDSALTLAIAVDALGSSRVRAVFMPSRYTADVSGNDAALLCQNFKVDMETISIESAYHSFLDSLKPSFKDKPVDVTEENIQARIRAIILMALSNKFGHLVLTTGNRSELAVGYCTLYGDMAGGFAVLKDIPKTLVYALCNYRNTVSPLIPKSIIERAPTAELAENQKDEDSLPPYPILDKILYYFLNEGLTKAEIITKGFDSALVERIVGLVYRNEYKRRQSAIGPRINHKSFGRDWRYPVTNRFRG